MQFKNSTFQNIAFALLGLFGLIIIINGINVKYKLFEDTSQIQGYNMGEYQLNNKEGFFI